MQKLTQERVRELFDYRDGRLYRKIQAGARGRVGAVAGCPNQQGYLQVGIGRKLYPVHRVVWLWHHGYLPESDVDHINRCVTDNRIENLREVSRACNLRNKGNARTNSSGVKGVCWSKSCGKWAAYVKVRGVRCHLGRHRCFLEAVCHRLAAEQSEGWEIDDAESPAFRYVKEHLKVDK